MICNNYLPDGGVADRFREAARAAAVVLVAAESGGRRSEDDGPFRRQE